MGFGPTSPFSPVGQFGAPFPRYPLPLDIPGIWPQQITRLQNEEEILENGLANCVTYLHALRKKKVRNERLLNTSPTLPRKKRKKVEQNNREIEQSITKRKREEQAYLNNLQACKANLFMAENMSYAPTELASVVPYQHSATARGSLQGSEPTEFSWNGWSEDVVVSPFQEVDRSSFFKDEIPPDQPVQTLDSRWDDAIEIKDVKRTHSLTHETAGTIRVLPVLPTTDQLSYLRSTLRPEARVFEPGVPHALHELEVPRQHLGELNAPPSLAAKCLEGLHHRHFSHAGITQMFERLSVQSRSSAKAHIIRACGNTAPEQSPWRKDAKHTDQRSRTHSL